MATTKPRLSVTLSEPAQTLVAKVANLAGQSQSSVVSELMDSAIPALQAMAAALKVVRDSPKEAQRIMTEEATRAALGLEQAQLDLATTVDTRTMEGRKMKRRRYART